MYTIYYITKINIIWKNILNNCKIRENIPKHGLIWENIRLGLDLIWEMKHLGKYPFGK